MNKKRLPPSMKIRNEINEIMNGMKTDHQFYEDPMTAVMRKAKELVIQEMLEGEVSDHLGRSYYERDPGKTYENGYRNGYENRRLKTPEGSLQLEVPQVRGGDEPYRSRIKEFFQTNSDVLSKLVVEMYVRGLSTRDIEDALETMTGEKLLSSRSVSTITNVLWEDYQRFCERDLSNYEVVYMVVDAVYEGIRPYIKSNEAILVAYGILSDGRKILLHMELGSKESYEFCKEFLRDMRKRGLNVPLSITSDGAPGMTKAIDEVFPHSLRIRCWVHKMRNLSGKLPAEIWEEIKPEIQAIRESLSNDDGETQLKHVVGKYKEKYPSFIKCLLDDHEALLNVLRLPRRHQKNVRSTNLVERTFVEERRRTKVIPQFLTEKSCLKLVFSVLYRASLRWQKVSVSDLDLMKINQLKKALGIITESRSTQKDQEALIHA